MTSSICIIGAGNMGSALAHGLVASDHRFHITLIDRHQERLKPFDSSANVDCGTAIPSQLQNFDVIGLCLKPYDMPVISHSIRGKINPKSLVISVLAGTTMKELRDSLDFHGPLVRAMPNIAATVGLSATAICTGENTEQAEKVLTEKIFNGIGESHWVPEDMLDAVTGLSGSGPAYVYMVIEALTDGGVKMGLPRQLALDLSVQTVLGSAKLVKESGLHPAVLRDQVSTPGGTTIHAIDELESHGLRSMLMKAVATATARSKTLRKQ